MSEKGLYRKLPKKICYGCDHPEYAPSKNKNPKTACKQCRKQMTSAKLKQGEATDEKPMP